MGILRGMLEVKSYSSCGQAKWRTDRIGNISGNFSREGPGSRWAPQKGMAFLKVSGKSLEA